MPDAKHRAIAKGLAAMHGNATVEAKATHAMRQHGDQSARHRLPKR